MMKKRIFSLITAAILMMSLLAACGESGPVSQEKAQQIALDHAGISEKDVLDIHPHIVEENGIPCYSFHITTASGETSVIVNASTGEVIE